MFYGKRRWGDEGLSKVFVDHFCGAIVKAMMEKKLVKDFERGRT